MEEIKMWRLDDTQNAVTDGDNIIMYFDDISPEIIQKVCEMYNSGTSLEWISAALANDNGCFDDQREFIIENITAYIKLTNMSEGQQSIESIIAQAEAETGTGIGEVTQFPPSKELTRGEKAALTRKLNASAAPKKAGTAEAIKLLEEKIQLIKLLDGAEVIDIPSGLGKTARDLMTELQKEQQTLVDSYLEKVQSL